MSREPIKTAPTGVRLPGFDIGMIGVAKFLERKGILTGRKYFNLLFNSWAEPIVAWLIWFYKPLTIELSFILADC